jgi:hypothetical protein
MDDDDVFDEKPAASEADREWRERTQQTNELAEQLQPPHEPDAERANASDDV